MEELQKLLEGAAKYNRSGSVPVRPLMEQLARDGQRPGALFITCADSRIDPVAITQSQPGDLFILRNIGNLVPAKEAPDHSVMATVEYAIGVLKVKTIIVCGHSDCGAMKVVHQKADLSGLPTAKSWLENSNQSVKEFEAGDDDICKGKDMPEHDCLSQVNVITQFENLLTYPLVKENVESGNLRLVGMWLDLANTNVEIYDDSEHSFVPVDKMEIEEYIASDETKVSV
jgi:carbonic anhydrase